MTTQTTTQSLPAKHEAPVYRVIGINPETGAVAMNDYVRGFYDNYGEPKNDWQEMNEYVESLAFQKYVVVVTYTTFNWEDFKFDTEAWHKLSQRERNCYLPVDYQVVINIHPSSIDCDCRKGIFCASNKQQVNYFRGKVAEGGVA